MRADSHTVLAQACLTVLLQGPDITNNAGSMPLVGAEHWVTHAQVKNVMSRVCDGWNISSIQPNPILKRGFSHTILIMITHLTLTRF